MDFDLLFSMPFRKKNSLFFFPFGLSALKPKVLPTWNNNRSKWANGVEMLAHFKSGNPATFMAVFIENTGGCKEFHPL